MADADLDWRDGERVRLRRRQPGRRRSRRATTRCSARPPGRRLIDTGGASVVRGVPAPGHRPGHAATGAVDGRRPTRSRSAPTSPSRPGAVVLRTPMFELIQYRPQTPKVRTRAAADRAADDQQVLRPRPGARPQPGRVPGRAGPAGVHHLLAQPRRPPPRLGPRRLRAGDPRGARRRRRHRRRATAARCWRLCSGGILAAMALAHLAAAGRRRPGRRVHPGGDRARPGPGRDRPARCSTSATAEAAAAASAAQGLPGRPDAGRGVRLAAPRRPDLELLGQQLPAGPHPGAVRHPVLERRHHPHDRGPAPRLPRSPRATRWSARGGDACSARRSTWPGRHRRLRRRRCRRPHLRRGSPATAARSCSAATTRASCCPPAGTSPRSSTRPATRRPAYQIARPNPADPAGLAGRRATRAGAPGGPTTSPGWRERSGGRRAAPATSAVPASTRLDAPPAATSSTDEATGPERTVQTGRHVGGAAAAHAAVRPGDGAPHRRCCSQRHRRQPRGCSTRSSTPSTRTTAVIRFDVPGAGGSPAPASPYGFPRWPVLGRRGCSTSSGYGGVDVLGFSWGGALAQQFALDPRTLPAAGAGRHRHRRDDGARPSQGPGARC